MADTMFSPTTHGTAAGRAARRSNDKRKSRMTLGAAMQVAREPYQYSDSDCEYAYGVMSRAESSSFALSALAAWNRRC